MPEKDNDVLEVLESNEPLMPPAPQQPETIPESAPLNEEMPATEGEKLFDPSKCPVARVSPRCGICRII